MNFRSSKNVGTQQIHRPEMQSISIHLFNQSIGHNSDIHPFWNVISTTSHLIHMHVIKFGWVQIYPTFLLQFSYSGTCVANLTRDLLYTVHTWNDSFHSQMWHKESFAFCNCFSLFTLASNNFDISIDKMPVGWMPFVVKWMIGLCRQQSLCLLCHGLP